jgi:hypothetical protein
MLAAASGGDNQWRQPGDLENSVWQDAALPLLGDRWRLTANPGDQLIQPGDRTEELPSGLACAQSDATSWAIGGIQSPWLQSRPIAGKNWCFAGALMRGFITL